MEQLGKVGGMAALFLDEIQVNDLIEWYQRTHPSKSQKVCTIGFLSLPHSPYIRTFRYQYLICGLLSILL